MGVFEISTPYRRGARGMEEVSACVHMLSPGTRPVKMAMVGHVGSFWVATCRRCGSNGVVGRVSVDA